MNSIIFYQNNGFYGFNEFNRFSGFNEINNLTDVSLLSINTTASMDSTDVFLWSINP